MIRYLPACVAALLLSVLAPALALADTGAATRADLSTIWPVVLTIAGAVIAYSAKTAGSAISARLKIQSGSAAADDLDQALEHGANLLLNFLGSFAAHNEAVALPAGVVAQAIQLVLKLAPAAIGSLGISEAEVTQMLTGKIGKALGQPVTFEAPIPGQPSTLLPRAPAISVPQPAAATA